MDEDSGVSDTAAARPGEWVTNEVRTASGDCVVTVTVRAPLELDRDVVRAAIEDAVRGIEALLGLSG